MKISFAEPDLPRSGAVVVGVWEGKALTPAARRLDEATGGAITPRARRRISVQRQEGRAAADRRPRRSFGEPDRPRRSRQARIGRRPIASAARRKSVRAPERRRREGGDVDDRRRRGRADRPSRGGGRVGLWRAAQILSLRQVQDQAEARAEAVARSPDGRDRRREGGASAPISRSRRPAEAVFFTRDLVSEPANVIYPETLAAEAERARRARRRGRDPRRAQDARARDERAARGRTRQRPAAPRRRHAVARRQSSAERAASRSPSSARASPSIPAASRSSRPPAWAT